jgi:hypothetical protein
MFNQILPTNSQTEVRGMALFFWKYPSGLWGRYL